MNSKFLHNLIRSFTRVDMIVMIALSLVILWMNVYIGIVALILVAALSLYHTKLMSNASDTFSQAAQALGASNLVWQAGEPPEALLCWSVCLVIDWS